MLKLVVSILLLPCVLLIQSASAIGHAHGLGRPKGHDICPHFHARLSAAPCRHDHGHHHGSDGHHHHHHNHHHDDGKGTPTSDGESSPQHDQDSDAVFITSIDVVINERLSVDEAFTTAYELAATEVYPFGSVHAVLLQWSENWTHPPPQFGCTCHIYIRHLALLL